MREGEVVRVSDGERVTCIRSGQEGGPFVFEFELAPGAGGPPIHTHDEGNETIELLEGALSVRVHGRDRVLRAGDRLTLTPDDPHTFRNASKTERVRARVTHGARFERLVVQPGFLATIVYLVDVDPGASRVRNPWLRRLMPLIARFARLRGVRPVGTPGEPPIPV